MPSLAQVANNRSGGHKQHAGQCGDSGDARRDALSEPISAGTEIHIKPRTAHGPHTTQKGCSVLVTFSYPSALDDFTLA